MPVTRIALKLLLPSTYRTFFAYVCIIVSMFVLVDQIRGCFQAFFANSSSDAKMDYRLNVSCLLKFWGDLLIWKQGALKSRAVLWQLLFNKLPEILQLPRDISQSNVIFVD